GLLLGAGAEHAGSITVADIGLPLPLPRQHLIEDADVPAWLMRRGRNAHKWQAAVYLVAGSPGMTGAAELAAKAALHPRAGMGRVAPARGAPGPGPGG